MENAILVGLITPQQPEDRTNEYLDELAFLAETRDIVPVKRFVQRLNFPDTNTYVGSGKLEEIRQYLIANDQSPVDLVIFDDELSPRQLRNIERGLNWRENPKDRREIRVMDRTILILEIFLQRAQTSYAKTQVEMAHLQYMLPRLTRMWSHLDRQRGGGGTNRGTGETHSDISQANHTHIIPPYDTIPDRFVQGICPKGWHVPSYYEFQDMKDYLSQYDIYRCGSDSMNLAKALAAKNIYCYNQECDSCLINCDSERNNSTGFTGLFAGRYAGPACSFFSGVGYYWTSTQVTNISASALGLHHNSPAIIPLQPLGTFFAEGHAVRCLKDE